MGDNPAKVGLIEGNILTYLKDYPIKLMLIPMGHPSTIKYGAILKEPPPSVMIIVSQRDEIVRPPDCPPYNMMITVMGKNTDRCFEILKDFEERMPFELRDPPELVKKESLSLFKLIQAMLD